MLIEFCLKLSLGFSIRGSITFEYNLRALWTRVKSLPAFLLLSLSSTASAPFELAITGSNAPIPSLIRTNSASSLSQKSVSSLIRSKISIKISAWCIALFGMSIICANWSPDNILGVIFASTWLTLILLFCSSNNAHY